MTDLELQDEVRGRIFARLVAAGIRKIDIEAFELFEELEKPGPEKKFEDLFCDMIEWLEAEGLLRCGGLAGSALGLTTAHSCQVSSLGLALADQPFGQGGMTATEVAKGASTDGTDAYAKLGAFIGTAAGKFLSSL
ncbi:hypothetical protein [Roseinatronobacter sp.]|uniref:hypothetical protein n=1 Tax=Roseinatronobacter sp. TaxID=1945755 RepID=UPI0025EC4EE5|nr:hypothetical protein [Roseibaca sp.]